MLLKDLKETLDVTDRFDIYVKDSFEGEFKDFDSDILMQFIPDYFDNYVVKTVTILEPRRIAIFIEATSNAQHLRDFYNQVKKVVDSIKDIDDEADAVELLYNYKENSFKIIIPSGYMEVQALEDGFKYTSVDNEGDDSVDTVDVTLDEFLSISKEFVKGIKEFADDELLENK